jgi:hypothetical protein
MNNEITRSRARFSVRKLCREGDLLPPWYGVAWDDWNCDRAVCYPVPLNLVAGIGRAIWIWMRHGWRGVRRNSREAFHQGYELGRFDRERPEDWRRDFR